ncbi:hypothetical protein BU24DRAFT_341763 [Aaosphaeria arxii CBS 175.79]|uniref:BTB domain-containing protein n=1 Tax=Aaosphaeria arxii CBS 175.79 TaxID=1450172 RepID=A0A6A5Y125_9PLEO|nr:uncharacterized protein BU24DRAFT_341763 [Aaosphaeria arxii CBS 175.79]KAF2019255.1 hypothetical protein BU24DRAFT_341763 [Aaosphaeria arxii CBS 175.79]
MADLKQSTPAESTPAEDIDMGEGVAAEGTHEAELTELEPESQKLVLFADLVKSPIVEVLVGTGDDRQTYSAHEAVLVKAPEFAKQLSELASGSTPRQIVYPDADVDAMGSVIEYLYTGEYFPKKTSTSRDAPLETDPRQPLPDNEGLGLLVHARIYTLAGRLQLPDLKSLAHSKIHRTASTAKGELAYARFVYKESSPEDAVIRKPVAAFWATRSYALRHDAEPEFKAMCLEFPQFSYDVLQLVLDQQEKKRGGGGSSSREVVATGESSETPSKAPQVVPSSTRKRARASHI